MITNGSKIVRTIVLSAMALGLAASLVGQLRLDPKDTKDKYREAAGPGHIVDKRGDRVVYQIVKIFVLWLRV